MFRNINVFLVNLRMGKRTELSFSGGPFHLCLLNLFFSFSISTETIYNLNTSSLPSTYT